MLKFIKNILSGKKEVTEIKGAAQLKEIIKAAEIREQAPELYKRVEIHLKDLRKQFREVKEKDGAQAAFFFLKKWFEGGKLKPNQVISISKEFLENVKELDNYPENGDKKYLDQIYNTFPFSVLCDNYKNLKKCYEIVEDDHSLTLDKKLIEDFFTESKNLTDQNIEVFLLIMDLLIKHQQPGKVFKVYNCLNDLLWSKNQFWSGFFDIKAAVSKKLAEACKTWRPRPQIEEYFLNYSMSYLYGLSSGLEFRSLSNIHYSSRYEKLKDQKIFDPEFQKHITEDQKNKLYEAIESVFFEIIVPFYHADKELIKSILKGDKPGYIFKSEDLKTIQERHWYNQYKGINESVFSDFKLVFEMTLSKLVFAIFDGNRILIEK